MCVPVLCLLEEGIRVVLWELRISYWSWGSVLELMRLVRAVELDEELGTCSLARKLGMWLAIRLYKYGCTLMRFVVFPPTLCMFCGVVVEVPTKVCCGGVFGALELDRALASYNLMLRLDSRLYLGLCKYECILMRSVNFKHSLRMFCKVLGGMFPLG